MEMRKFDIGKMEMEMKCNDGNRNNSATEVRRQECSMYTKHNSIRGCFLGMNQ
jgi:hypothetical protein